MLRIRRLERAGGEQRVGKTDSVALGLDDASLEGRHETPGSTHTRRRLGDRDGRMRMGGSCDQEVPTLGWQGKQTAVDKVMERVGHG